MDLRFWKNKPIEVVNELEKKKSLNDEVMKEPIERVRESLNNWAMAVQDAENPFIPESIKYQNLLNLYRNIELDPHVSAVTETIYNRVNQTPFKIIDSTGEINEDKTELFKSSWFAEFIENVLEADYWGFSLIQITEIEDGNIKSIDNINRFYVRPESKGVSTGMWQDEIKFKYDAKPLSDWTIFVKSRKHLGRYNTIAKRFILKREVEQFWAVFNELFTTPYYTIKTDFDNSKHRNNLIEWLDSRKHSGYAVVGIEDEINAIQGGGAGFNSYQEFEKSANQAISKAFLGSTMVLEDGSSRSQAEVHDSNTESFIQSKRVWVESIINEKLIPLMVNFGMLSKGDRFEWVMSQKMTVMDWADLSAKLAPYFELDSEQVGEKTGLELDKKAQIPVTGKTNEQINNMLSELYGS